MMQYSSRTIYVKDITASIQFYEEIVGLTVDRRYSRQGMELAFMSGGDHQLQLIQGQMGPCSGVCAAAGYKTESVAQKQAFLKARGIPVHSGPDARVCCVYDPDGTLVQFMEPA